MSMRKAVVPAAGLGTRFLPATKAIPKEMLPVVDTPAIQYVGEEAAAAGLSDVLMITARGNGALEDHFYRAWELETALEEIRETDRLRNGVWGTRLTARAIMSGTNRSQCCLVMTSLMSATPFCRT